MKLRATFGRDDYGDFYCIRGDEVAWGRTRLQAWLGTWLLAPPVYWLRCRWARLGLLWSHYTDPRRPPL